MKLEEILREKEIKEIKDFIENTNEYKELSNDSLLIPKLLVIDGTDKYSNSLILDEISEGLKIKTKEVTIENIEKISKKKINKHKLFLLINDMDIFILKFGMDKFKDYITSIKSKKNLYLIMMLNKTSSKYSSYCFAFQKTYDKLIDVDLPTHEEIKKYLEKLKTKFDIFKDMNLDELSDIFFKSSKDAITKTCMLIDKDYKNNKLKEITYRTFFEYHSKLIHDGIINKLEEDEKRTVAYHEVGHLIMDYASNKSYGIVSILGYGGNLGQYTSQFEHKDGNSSYKSMESLVIKALGGYACTNYFLNCKYGGAKSDITLARYVFLEMCNEGMFGFECLPTQKSLIDQVPGNAKYQETEAEFLDDCLRSAYSNLDKYKDKVELLVNELIKKEVLFKKDIMEILDGD